MGFNLQIFSPKSSYENTVTRLVLPGGEGEIGILPGHARLITYLVSGRIKITGEGFEEYCNIGFGLVEVYQNKVTIITEDFVRKN